MIYVVVVMVAILSLKMFIELNQKANHEKYTLSKSKKFKYMSILLFIYAYITLFIPMYFFEPINIPSNYKFYLMFGYWIISNIIILNLSARKKEDE